MTTMKFATVELDINYANNYIYLAGVIPGVILNDRKAIISIESCLKSKLEVPLILWGRSEFRQRISGHMSGQSEVRFLPVQTAAAPPQVLRSR